MRNDADGKPFDVMKWLRETRDWICEETRDMSWEERKAWYGRPSGAPILDEWFAGLRRVRPIEPNPRESRPVASGQRTKPVSPRGHPQPEGARE